METPMEVEQCGETLITQALPIRAIAPENHIGGDGKHDSGGEPCIGLEFGTADDALEFYKLYATNSGFGVRVGQLSRSKVNGSVTSRKYVCSKEGFQRQLATGCNAYIRVQKQDSGLWIVDRFQKNHTHDLVCQQKSSSHAHTATISSTLVSSTPKKSGSGLVDVRSAPEETDTQAFTTGGGNIQNHTRQEDEGESKLTPYVGMEFHSSEEAHDFYCTYAHSSGFNIRSGQLTRSKIDGSVKIRRYVCSKEGFQLHSRVGCQALIRIKIQESGKWVLDRFQKDHNHSLERPEELPHLSTTPKSTTDALHSSGLMSPKMTSNVEEAGAGMTSVYKDRNHYSKGIRRSSIGSDWYCVILEYLRSKQAGDAGFFHAVEVDDGRCMSVFWADSKSRFSCSQFGDVVVFDTRFRTSSYVVPFASFVGVNHHQQPVLLGCALVADESKESFNWLFETWRKAMSGCRPLTIIADQDKVIRQAAAQVFPGTNYCVPTWNIKAKERENLGQVCAMYETFKYEYESCVNKSRMAAEFESAWAELLNKYKLTENEWLKEMYEDRKLWVPLYLRGTFFAGITTSGSEHAYFGTLVNSGTPLNEFISQYEKAVERRREEEQKDDFVSMHKCAVLITNDPIENQCEQLYSRSAFFRFREELMECSNCAAKLIDPKQSIGRYLVYKHENEEEKHIVTLNSSNVDVTCSCQMFESEGFLCKHVLKVFRELDIMEVPSRYILRRWTKDCQYGTISDVQSLRSRQECITSMVWSLRKEACKFIELGTMSLEQFDVAFSILHEGRIKLYSMNPVTKQTRRKKQKV